MGQYGASRAGSKFPSDGRNDAARRATLSETVLHDSSAPHGRKWVSPWCDSVRPANQRKNEDNAHAMSLRSAAVSDEAAQENPRGSAETA